jgi:hypothetical protein
VFVDIAEDANNNNNNLEPESLGFDGMEVFELRN